jgi:hypothetical protein
MPEHGTENRGGLAESITRFRQIIQADPSNVQAWIGLADALREQRQTAESIHACRDALRLEPANIEAMHLLGWGLIDNGQVRDALQLINEALAIAPTDPKLRWLRAFALLLLGDYERGWADYEARWEIPGLSRTRNDFPKPQWRGEDLSNKTIYLYPEQGLGDSMQFVRYVPLLRERGPAKILLATPPELESLFLQSMPDIQQIRAGQAIPMFDYHCSLMSLPLAFGTTLQTIPANVPYLRPREELFMFWRRRLAAYPGVKVGLAWAGGPRSQQNTTRSMHLSQLRELAGLRDIRFVSLQKGDPAKQVAEVPDLDLLDWTGELKDFADTAALVSALDLVVTVCTSIAHIAGATGRPTWTMLAYAADFRWMLERTDTPWYPTMRLYRQPQPQDWPSVIEQVRRDLVGAVWRQQFER